MEAPGRQGGPPYADISDDEFFLNFEFPAQGSGPSPSTTLRSDTVRIPSAAPPATVVRTEQTAQRAGTLEVVRGNEARQIAPRISLAETAEIPEIPRPDLPFASVVPSSQRVGQQQLARRSRTTDVEPYVPRREPASMRIVRSQMPHEEQQGMLVPFLPPRPMLEREELEGMQLKLKEMIEAVNIETRQGPGGSRLSYVSGSYVVEKANEIFGEFGWSSETKRMNQISGTDKVTYMATVRVTVFNTCYREGTGMGIGEGSNIQMQHEKAMKEAETDALKRAFRQFGNVLGNQIYRQMGKPKPAPKPAPRTGGV